MVEDRFRGSDHTRMISKPCLKDMDGMVGSPKRHFAHLMNGRL
jgi:hypothetical protein